MERIPYYLRGVLLFALFSMLSVAPAEAQRGINIWYFGNQAGLDFNVPPATPTAPSEVTTSVLSSVEGSALATDRTTGGLLFYTNGIVVLDRNNTNMPGATTGNTLGGGSSSTQAALSVPDPGNPNRYYLFTTPDQGSGQAEFSIVDMTQRGGLGDVTVRRQTLPTLGGIGPPTRVCEKLAATRDATGTGHWVVVHEYRDIPGGSNAFYAYHVSATGIDAVRVSNVGTGIGPLTRHARGELKISPDGTFLATANEDLVSELFRFNNSTGAVTLLVTLDAGVQHYGLSFSPNSRLLYINDGWNDRSSLIEQFNLANPAPAAILASRTTVGVSSLANLGGMQIAPDGRIYIARNTFASIAAIDCPNVVGTGCGFVDNAFTFTGGRRSSWGMPALILESVATPEFAGPDTTLCAGQSVTIGLDPITGYTYRWDANPTISNVNIARPVASPTATTRYTVQVTSPFGCVERDTIDVTINPLPNVTVTPDTSFCAGESIRLVASGGTTFRWTPAVGLSDATIPNPIATPTATTTYTVTVTDGNSCSNTGTVTVTVNPRPVAVVSPDAAICTGDSAALTASGGLTVRWEPIVGLSNPNSPNTMASPAATTTYSAIVTSADGCRDTGSVTVTVNPPPVAVVTPFDTICAGKSTVLSASGGTIFRWSPATGLSDTSSPNPTANPVATTTYQVVVENQFGCLDSADVLVTVITPEVRLILPDTLADPHTRGFRIPISLESVQQTMTCVPDSFSVELEFNATLFFPRGVSRGAITSNQIVEGRRIITISFDSATPTSTGLLTELVGDVLLGDSVSTDLQVRSIRFSGVIVNTDSTNGSLGLTPLCLEGGARLLEFGNGFGVNKIVPNPSGGPVVVEVRTVELGITELSVYSTAGVRLFNVEWVAERSASTGGEFRQVSLPLDLPVGLYMLVLQTPMRRDVKTFIITK